MTKYRVMGIDECGSEAFIAHNLTEGRAIEVADDARERLVEYRSIFIEPMADYHKVWKNRWMNDEIDLY